MKPPLYEGIGGLTQTPTSHKGLWFDRFYYNYDQTWKVNNDNAKKDWINTVTLGNCGDAVQLSSYAEAQKQLCASLNGQSTDFINNWHFVSGMGNPHPVENGMSWHPTLGVPYLTGASVKGLVRAFAEEWCGIDKEKLYRWFGSEHKNPSKQTKESQAGSFIFFDAFPIAPVTLHNDVMTPHMGNWYSDGGNINKDASNDKSNSYSKALPADWHDPNIIPFLVVKDITLQFCIAPRPNNNLEDSEKELLEIHNRLEQALEFIGAGAKTSAGYGYFLNEETKKKKEQEHETKQALGNAIERTEVYLKKNLRNQSFYIEKGSERNIAMATTSALKESISNSLNETQQTLLNQGKGLKIDALVDGKKLLGINKFYS